MHSTSNLDVLCYEPVDVIVALNPMSSLHISSPRTVGERLAIRMRQTAGRRLGSEAKQLRAAGKDVILIQPTVHDLDVMGGNLMSRDRRHAVVETAVRTVTDHIRETPLGVQLAQLPSAPDKRLVRRPKGPPSSWPDFHQAAVMRFKPPGGRRLGDGRLASGLAAGFAFAPAAGFAFAPAAGFGFAPAAGFGFVRAAAGFVVRGVRADAGFLARGARGARGAGGAGGADALSSEPSTRWGSSSRTSASSIAAISSPKPFSAPGTGVGLI